VNIATQGRMRGLTKLGFSAIAEAVVVTINWLWNFQYGMTAYWRLHLVAPNLTVRHSWPVHARNLVGPGYHAGADFLQFEL
jgi:hypothetical protein